MKKAGIIRLMSGPESQNIEIRAEWDIPETVPAPANQFAILQGANNNGVTPTSYELHFGFMSAPILQPDAPGFAEKVSQGIALPIRSVAHVQVPIELLVQLRDILTGVVASYEEQVGFTSPDR